MMRRLPRSERGSVAIETAVVMPGLIMIIGLLVVGGRFTIADGAVEHAAAEAARAASIARTYSEAVESGIATAKASLAEQDIECANGIDIDIDASGFSQPPGEPASVSATITCDVDLSDVAIPGLPGTREITETAESPLDLYRYRR